MPAPVPAEHVVSAAAALVPRGEPILWSSRPSLRWVVLSSLVPLLWCLALGVVGWLLIGRLHPWPERLVMLAVALAVVTVLWKMAVWYCRIYVLTPKRVLVRFGVFTRGVVDLPLERIQSVILKASLLERLLAIGNIGFASAAGGVELAWVGVGRTEELHRRVNDQLAERGMVSAGGRPDPAGTDAGPTARSREEAGKGSGEGPRIIGLAGGIAAGKSRVGEELEALGCVVVDSDRQAREILRREEIRETLVTWWGKGVLGDDGQVDRRAVARIVFEDPAERKRLEDLVHPLIRVERDKVIAEATRRNVPAVVIDAPLLFEAGLDVECDAVIFVDAPRAKRLERVKTKRNWTEEELDRREAAQWPLERKRKASTHVIVNDGPDEPLREAVAETLEAILKAPPRPQGTTAARQESSTT